MKLPRNVRRDFKFFRDTPLNMIGAEIGNENCSAPDGLFAIECFYWHDVYGKKMPCHEPAILAKVQQGKRSWNLQIKMWAESLVDDCGPTLTKKELGQYCAGLPEWIYRATLKQAEKLALKKFGWVPSFCKL